MKHNLLILIALVALSACHPVNPPTPKPLPIEATLTLAKQKHYGQFYHNLPRSVFSLDFYSVGLSFDSLDYVQGSGINLYFSDIFMDPEATTLADGTYILDSVASPFTFLPGMNIDGGITGAYVLLLQEAELKKIYYVTSGSFTLATRGDTTDFSCHLMLDSKQSYDATYSGVLIRE